MPKKPVAAPIYVLAALLVWLAAPAFAAPVRGLYEAAVPVADQGAGARDAALRRALESVLVRVTGDRHAVQNPSLGPVVARAATLVQGYGYDNGGGTGLLLRAQFDARAIDAALRAQGVPIWGSNRPSVALFAALRDDGQPRAVLDTAGVAARAPVIAAIAAARGLSLLYPDGGHAPAFSDVAMQNRELLLRTAQRIGADQ
ncbi:MAG TPA: DUF2066 domain-containing protein, partial [Candidatus Binatia bacterium]|nr:DUF2066 domain-containing protein [Candidatus Binatia bacterium]